MNTRRTPSKKRLMSEGGLFTRLETSLWDDLLRHNPRRPAHFAPERIVFASGCFDTPQRAAFADRIVNLYPQAHIEHCPKLAHNKIPSTFPECCACWSCWWRSHGECAQSS